MKLYAALAVIALWATLSFAEDTNVFLVAYPHEFNPPYALMRGTVNFMTCWLEIPRCAVVQNARHPVIGIGTGLLQSAFFMCSRIILSTADYLLLGFTGPSAYDAVWLPEYVFQAEWYPYVGEYIGTNAPHAAKQP